MTDYIKEWKQEEVRQTIEYIEKMRIKLNELKERKRNGEINYFQYQEILKTLMAKKIVELIQYYNLRGLEEEVEKMVDKHFDALQAKVEKKIGKIITIESLSGTGYDYRFTGKTGNCVIRLVNAGGYNIQIAHTRWIIK